MPTATRRGWRAALVVAALVAAMPAAVSAAPRRHPKARHHSSRRHHARPRHRTRLRHRARLRHHRRPPGATGPGSSTTSPSSHGPQASRGQSPGQSPGSAPTTTGPTGYDISYPQCGKSYPAGQVFGVVGVNGGLANNSNPCLASELSWAAGSPGSTSPSQPPASLYLNTGDPGPVAADWPSPVRGTGGGATPYGTCDGTWSAACAYVYGQQRAAYSYGLAAQASGGLNVSPARSPWWLDVETVNSWAGPAASSNWATLNIATLQGFVAGLRGSGATGSVGFYSTASQWQAITGLTASTSGAYFSSTDPDWVAGAGSLSAAQANCSASFSGGRVALAQYPSGGFDGDYACP